MTLILAIFCDTYTCDNRNRYLRLKQTTKTNCTDASKPYKPCGKCSIEKLMGDVFQLFKEASWNN